MAKETHTPNIFANQGKPAFAAGNTGAAKMWALVCIIGFSVFWVAGLFTAAEFFGERDASFWAEGLTAVGLIVGLVGRVMMGRANPGAR